MATTTLRTKTQTNIGLTPINVLAPTTTSCTIIGCNLANITDDDVIIDIKIIDAGSVSAYYIKQLVIPPYNSVKVITNGEKLIIAQNYKLQIVCDTANGIDAVISYAEIG
jgi:hypothetical protein